MHARAKLAVVGTALAIIVLLPGCRNSPLERFVQIQKQPISISPEAPPARLMGAQVRGPRPQENIATASLSDLEPRSTESPRPSLPDGAAEQELLAAFEGSSPEVRELARRQLEAIPQVQAAKPATSEATDSPDMTKSGEAKAEANELAAQIAAAPAGESAADESTAAGDAAASGSDVALASNLQPTSTTPEEAAPGAVVAADNVVPADNLVAAENRLAAATSAPGDAPAEASPSDSTTDLSAVSDEALLAELLRRYEDRETDDAADVQSLSEILSLRMLYLLSGQLDNAVMSSTGLDSREQEYLNHQMLGLWHLLDPSGHPVRQRRWAAALPELRLAVSQLAAATGVLEVRGLTFCTEVQSYGHVTPFKSTRFRAGQQVIIYCELENFAAERLSDGYETHLQGSYDIFDESGARVAEQVLPADRQVCNVFRRDYFIAYKMYLPQGLQPGHYHLQLTLEDVKGKKFGQSKISFEIDAPSKS